MGIERYPFSMDFVGVWGFDNGVVVGGYGAGLGGYCLKGFGEGFGDDFFGEVW